MLKAGLRMGRGGGYVEGWVAYGARRGLWVALCMGRGGMRQGVPLCYYIRIFPDEPE